MSFEALAALFIHFMFDKEQRKPCRIDIGRLCSGDDLIWRHYSRMDQEGVRDPPGISSNQTLDEEDQKESIAKDLNGATDILSLSTLAHLGTGSLQHMLKKWSSSDDEHGGLQSLWRRVLITVQSPAVNDKHLTTACNVLSILLHAIFSPETTFLPGPKGSERMWRDAFAAMKRALSTGKTKPALQVLDALMSVINQSAIANLLAGNLRAAVSSELSVILLAEPASQMKDALTITYHSLRRGHLSVTDLFDNVEQILSHRSRQWRLRLGQRNHSFRDSVISTDSSSLSLIIALFLARFLSEARHATMKMFHLLCQKARNEFFGLDFSIIRQAMELYILGEAPDIDLFFLETVPSIIDTKEQYHAFLQTFHAPSTSTQMLLILGTLRAGREARYLSEDELPGAVNLLLSSPDNIGIEKSKNLSDPLRSSNITIRSQAYKVLTWSSTTTTPLNETVMRIIQRSWRYIHDEGDAHYRGEILGATRKLFLRLNDSIISLRRQELDAHMHQYLEFLEQTTTSMITDLKPTSSYQRHVMALQTLKFLLDMPNLVPYIQKWINMEDAMQGDLSKTLLGLVFDPFEDVRELSTHLFDTVAKINGYSYASFGSASLDAQGRDQGGAERKFESFAAATCRSDHADGLGRIYGLTMTTGAYEAILHRLEQFLHDLKNLQLPTTFPLHGLILALRYGRGGAITSHEICFRLIDICTSIWNLVQEHLCIDSPEFSVDDSDVGDNIGPKDVLSYSWRALRDSSLLLQAILSIRPESMKVYTAIGDLCLAQLIQLRHRGAFSVVAQTFSACCQAVSGSRDQHIRCLRKQWYSLAVQQVDIQADRLTRRSAGIPSMVACTLHPNNSRSMADFIASFVEKAAVKINSSGIAKETADSTQLPQVHAFNCLREVVTNSRFRSVSETYILLLLDLAISHLSSAEWAIRNCALMLLRACLTRIDQTRRVDDQAGRDVDNATLGSVAHPLELAAQMLESINPVVLDSLSKLDVRAHESTLDGPKDLPGSASSCPEKVFAALDLVSRLHLTESAQHTLRQMIEPHLSSPLWTVRERTANVLADSPSAYEKIAYADFHLISHLATQNAMHGHLLLYKLNATKMLHIDTAERSRVRQHIHYLKVLASDGSLAPFVRIEAFRVVNLVNETLTRPRIEVMSDSPLLDGLETRLPELHSSLRVPIVVNAARRIFETPAMGSLEQTRLLRNLLVKLLLLDEDAAMAVLAEVHSLSTGNPGAWIEALCCLLNNDIPEGFLTQVMMLIDSNLASHAISLSHERLVKLWQQTNTFVVTAREAFVTTLKLQAVLLAIGSRACLRVFGHENGAISSWLLRIKFAVRDTVDRLTREAAAESLSSLISLAIRLGSSSVFRNNLDLGMILYDLVKDDDEGIRAIASETIAMLLNDLSFVQSAAACSLAASESLVEHIRETHKENPDLAILAARRVLATDRSISKYCSRNPVDFLFGQIVGNSCELFAEEKQNLYIDELEEVRIWSGVLREVGAHKLPVDDLQSLERWAEQGLLHMATAFKDHVYEETGFPLGLTCNPDIQVLMAKSISLVGCLIHNQPVTPENTAVRNTWTGLSQTLNVRNTNKAVLEVLQDAKQ